VVNAPFSDKIVLNPCSPDHMISRRALGPRGITDQDHQFISAR
jgi:hypothetical protein